MKKTNMKKTNMKNKLAQEITQFYKDLILHYGLKEVLNNPELFPLILLSWQTTNSSHRNHFRSCNPVVTIYYNENYKKYFLYAGNFSNIKHLNGLELPCSSFSEAQKYVDKLLTEQNCILVD